MTTLKPENIACHTEREPSPTSVGGFLSKRVAFGSFQSSAGWMRSPLSCMYPHSPPGMLYSLWELSQVTVPTWVPHHRRIHWAIPGQSNHSFGLYFISNVFYCIHILIFLRVISFLKKLFWDAFFLIVYARVCFAYMNVHHKHQYIQCSRRPAEGIGCKGTGVTDPCEPCGFLRMKPGLSERGVRDLNHWDNSPVSHIHILYHLLWFYGFFGRLSRLRMNHTGFAGQGLIKRFQGRLLWEVCALLICIPFPQRGGKTIKM